VIPDTQVKPGVPTAHLSWLGKYVVDKKPDIVVHLGDHWDMPSLSSYDKGKKGFEGRRYKADVAAGNAGMDLLMAPLLRSKGRWRPELFFTIGNHEERILRVGEASPELDGVVGYHDLNLKGWEVSEFKEVITVCGVEFAHFFTSGVYGRAVTSARALLAERMESAIMGHVQLYDTAIHKKTQKRGIFAGTFYQHDEAYLGPQDNSCRRHVLMLHEVTGGRFDLMEVSLGFLRRTYG
jgi:hypothetical protein